jgi:REP element-mobilizing transposase RayT
MPREIFHRLVFHCVWSTAGRQPVFDSIESRVALREAIIEIASRHGGHVIACAVQPVHAHLLFGLAPRDISRFVGIVKGGSAFAFNRRFPDHCVRWQDGYGIVSVGDDGLERVSAYIDNQETIHASRLVAALLERDGSDD